MREKEFRTMPKEEKNEWIRGYLNGENNIYPETFTMRTNRDMLSQLKGKDKLTESMSPQEVFTLFNETELKIKELIKKRDGSFPAIIRMATSMYEESGLFSFMSVDIQPNKKGKLSTSNMHHKHEYRANEGSIDIFIEDVGLWLDLHEYYSSLEKYQVNINKIFQQIITDIDSRGKFMIGVAVGDGFVDISDKHVILGLSEDTLYSFGMESLRDGFVESICPQVKEIFEWCGDEPYNILKTPEIKLTEKLNIKTREYPTTSLKNIFKEDIGSIRDGIGYCEIDREDMFAVIKKELVSQEELKSRTNEGYYVSKKKRGCERDIPIYTYVISPFSTEDFRSVPMDIQELSEYLD